MGANDRLRAAVHRAAMQRMEVYNTGIHGIASAITAGVMAGLEHVELEGPRPDAEHAGEGEPALGGGGEAWESEPDRDGDRVMVRPSDTGGVWLAVDDKAEHCRMACIVHIAEVPHMCRAVYEAGRLPWPGDEVERLRERVRELESATCMPEVMAVVKAWRGVERRGMRGFQMDLDKPLRALVEAVRSGKRCGLHPATVEVLDELYEAWKETDGFDPRFPLNGEDAPRLAEKLAKRLGEAMDRDRHLPREGGES
jgi:hypothetical protein